MSLQACHAETSERITFVFSSNSRTNPALDFPSKPKQLHSTNEDETDSEDCTIKTAASTYAGSSTISFAKEVSFANDASAFQVILLDDVPVASQMTASERAEQWWDLEQVDNFRRNAGKVAKKPLPQSHLAVLTKLHQACDKTDSGDIDLTEFLEGQRSLITWAVKNCRGLEKRTLTKLRDDSKTRKAMLAEAIMVLQRIDAFDNDTKAEKIRFCCERLSMPSRYWARTMGLSDFLAQVQEDSDEASNCST